VKKLIQLFIILTIIISFYLIFKNYLINDQNKEVTKSNLDNSGKIDKIDDGDNLIKNLRYEINLNQNQKYILTAKKSNISNLDDTEIVYMEKVKAIFFDKKGNQMIVTSDTGMFNSSTYDSEFSNNIKINYDNHEIVAEKMNLNFAKKIIKIYKDVIYFNTDLSLVADIISINLVTNKTDIFMNNNKKVLINKN
jgi:hypothetical protein